MRVVITGATGNVGTSLIEALETDDEITSVTGLARRSPSWRPAKTTWAQIDVASDELAPHLESADALVHLAWIFQPTHDPLATWRNNVLGSIRVFEAAARAGVGTLVYASSVGAYSPGPQDRAVDEGWPTHALPTTAYGREKAYVERVLDSFEHEHPQIRVVRLRPAFIFKREAAPEQRRLFAGPLVPGVLLRPGLIPIVPDLPGLTLQALHASDAAEAYRLALVRPAKGAFNVAADPVLDAHMLAELFDARVVKVPRQAVRAAVAAAWHLRMIPASPQLLDLALSLPVMDSSKAREELGWSPQHTSMDAMRAFIEGLQDSADMDTPPLMRRAGGLLRHKEIASGAGSKADPPSPSDVGGDAQARD